MLYPVLVWQIRCKAALWNAHAKSHQSDISTAHSGWGMCGQNELIFWGQELFPPPLPTKFYIVSNYKLYLFKGPNEFLGLCSKVEHRSHHPSWGAEEKQPWILPTFQQRHQPNLQCGGNLDTKQTQSLGTTCGKYVSAFYILVKRTCNSNSFQVAIHPTVVLHFHWFPSWFR